MANKRIPEEDRGGYEKARLVRAASGKFNRLCLRSWQWIDSHKNARCCRDGATGEIKTIAGCNHRAKFMWDGNDEAISRKMVGAK